MNKEEGKITVHDISKANFFQYGMISKQVRCNIEVEFHTDYKGHHHKGFVSHPNVKITSSKNGDEECLPKSKYDLKLIEQEDLFQEQRLDIIEENMNQLDFLDKEIFSQSLTGSWFVDQDDIQKSSSNFRDFFLLTNDSSLPKAKASLKMMNYDLINSSFHTGDAYIQSLS